MSSETRDLTSSDLAVLETLNDSTESVSQRELARRTGLSVGLINAVIRKLVQTGYVKTGHLNRRQLEYLLTPEGFTRAAMKSYHYIVDTAHRYQGIRLKLRGLLDGLKKDGITSFYLHGDGELAELVAVFFAEDGRGTLVRGLPAGTEGGAAVLNASPQKLKAPGQRIVDLVGALGNGREGGPRQKKAHGPLRPEPAEGPRKGDGG